jgi:DNA-binding LytR/AlgR family response regulator
MTLTVKRSQKKEFSIKDVMFVPYRDFYFVVNISEILYIKADRSYCKIVVKSAKEYVVISSLKTLLKKLPDYFIRTHNSYIINIFYANSIHNGSIVKLYNNNEIPISRRKKKELFDTISII